MMNLTTSIHRWWHRTFDMCDWTPWRRHTINHHEWITRHCPKCGTTQSHLVGRDDEAFYV